MKIVRAATAALLLSGCVLLDPTYPSRTSPVYNNGGKFYAPPAKAGKGKQQETGTCQATNNSSLMEGSKSLRCAFDHSVTLQQTYLRAASRHDLARSITGPAVIGGSAYALLMGISPGIAPQNAADQIAAIGTGGAALYGASNFLVSARRQDVYIAGAKAISCLQERTRPFILSTDADLRLRSALFGQEALQEPLYPPEPLSTLRSTVLSAVRTVETIPGYDDAAKAHVDAARALVNASLTTEARGLNLLAEIEGGAAQAFSISLRKIDIDVAAELRKTQPELSTILTIVDGLGGISAKIAGRSLSSSGAGGGTSGAQSLQDKPLSTANRQRLEDAVEDLIKAIAKLQYSVDLIDGVVSSVVERMKAVGQEIRGNETPTVVRLGDCVMAPVDNSLRTDKAELAFTQGTAATQTLKVEGGEWPFVARFEGSPAGLSPTQSPEFGRTVTIAYDGKAAATTMPAQLKVTDKFGGSAAPVAVKIVATTTTATVTPPAPAPNEPPDTPLGRTWRANEGLKAKWAKLSDTEKQNLSVDGAQQVQRALCLGIRDGDGAIDADFGAPGADTATRRAVKQFHTDIGKAPGDALTGAEINELGADCVALARSWYEHRLIKGGKMDEVLKKVDASFNTERLNEAGTRTKILAIADTPNAGYENAMTRARCLEIMGDAKKVCADVVPTNIRNSE